MTELPARDAATWVSGAEGRTAFLRAVGREVAADGLLYALIGAYAVATVAIAAGLGVVPDIRPFSYMVTWIKALALCLALYLLVVEVPPSLRADPASPLARLRQRLPMLVTPRLVAGLMMVLAVGLFMGVFTTVKTMLPLMVAFEWDPTFADLDKALHGEDPWRLLHPVMGHPWLTRASEWGYTTLWMALTVAAPAVAAIAPGMARHRTRFLLTYFLCWIVLGNLLAGLFFSGGPCFYEQITGDGARFAELTAYHKANFTVEAPNVYVIQQWLWRVHTEGGMELANGVSAFPSLHVAMATLAAVAGFCLSRTLGWIGLAYLALTLASSVHLGWHYAVDGYASILGALLIWFALAPLSRPHGA